ncbi:MAG: hypothetical protein IJM51_03320 [Clostridia bacterium]|nr:hypothetical protein [Clostridia bacterium]
MISVWRERVQAGVKRFTAYAAGQRGAKILSICLSAAVTLLLPAFLSDSTLLFSNSFVSVVFAAALYLLFRTYRGAAHCRRELVLTHLLGMLLSLFTAAGRAMEQSGQFFPVSPLKAAGILLYGHVFACGISLVWNRLSASKPAFAPSCGGNAAGAGISGRLLSFAAARPWLVAVSLLVCWVPCYIALFPGGFMYDVSVEFHQQYDTYLSCFPRLHSALLIGCLNAAHRLTGSYNAGIALYCGVQMAVFSALFTHMLVIFYRQEVRPVLLYLSWLYFAFFPVIHLIITETGRDTLFALFFVYLVTLLYVAADDAEGFFRSPWKPALLGAVLALTVLSRNNTSELLVMLLLTGMAAIAWLLFRGKYFRGITVFSVSCLAVFFSLSLLLGAVCSPMQKANQGSAFGLVIQPLSRAYTEEKDNWSEDDLAELEKFIDAEHLRYSPELADTAREAMKEEAIKSDIRGFVKLWVRTGLRYPCSYLNAVTALTRYGWYPDSVLDGYFRANVQAYEKSYFITGVSYPGYEPHIWSGGEDYYRKIAMTVSFEKIPVVSMLFSVGFQNWLMLHCFFYAVYRRRRSLYLPLGVILVYLMICFFVPIVIMRYYMPLFLLLPLSAVMTLHYNEKKGSAQRQ